MGSGTTRRPADIISTGAIKKNSSGGGGGVQGKSVQEQKCPTSLAIPLAKTWESKTGLKVELKISSDGVKLISGIIVIHEIKGVKGIQLLNCLKNGFNYRGIIRSLKGRVYAEVRRAT